MSLEDLLNIEIVTAVGNGQKVKDAPAIVSVITKNDLQNWNVSSVGEALSRVPGFYCSFDMLSYNCGVRGINGGFRGHSKVIKVMINGQSVAFRSDTNNYIGQELIPLNIIERIEIVRGPSSALYGANAFLGVVNIITKTATKEFNATFNANVNTIESGTGYDFSAGVQGTTQGWKYNLAASFARTDRSGLAIPNTLPSLSTLKIGQDSENDIAQPFNVYGDIGKNFSGIFKPDDQLDISLIAWYSKLDSDAQWLDFGYFGQSGSLGYGHHISIENQYLKLASQYQYSKDLRFDGWLAIAQGNPTQDEYLDLGVPSFIPSRQFGFDSVEFQFEATWSLLSSRTLVMGIDNTADDEDLLEVYRIDRQTGEKSLATNAQGSKKFDNLGIYLQYTDFITDDFGLTLNIRHDDHNIYGNETNYRAGLVYSFNNNLSTKLLYGTSYKAPAALQLFSQPLFSGEVNGNPDLLTESADTLELAVDWKVSNEINLSMTLFKTHVEDKVEVVGTQAFNAGLQSSHGLEADFKWVRQDLSIIANFSWQKTDAETQNFIGQVVEYPSSMYPKLMTRLFASYKINKGFSAHAGHSYISPRRASETNILLNGTSPYQLEAYHLVDFIINYKVLDNAKVYVKATNLFNEKYQQVGFNGLDVAGLPRMLTLGFNFNYN
ncbi:TonB-dependent receptor [Paraglaciecola aquimarina]|uniref:TonB-dependent receptor n=1 Tax=Paraglaciecola algarum TaxID=3050085 RepID=A0ABS9DCX9_9ALTE|nr:TonB-dependent receptor [Paraglaciecola sp. G1-23]MCF2949496.1 TonB-dependent receptor [Paraglaciecola sp. G1-23]